MSTTSIEFLLDVPATLSVPNKKWHSAFAKIYCSRTLLSLAKNPTPRESREMVSQTVSSTSIEFLLDVPATLSVPNKKWRSAFAKIYCFRTLLSLAKNPILRESRKMVLRSSSSTAVDVRNDKLENEFFKIDPRSLTELVKEKNLDQLRKFDGINGVASALKTNIRGGIFGSDEDNARRLEAFGSNTYKKPRSKSFLKFVVEAFKKPTILIRFGIAVHFLVFGIKKHGLREGWWCKGWFILFTVFLVIALSAVSNYWQNRIFDKLSIVGNNIQIEIVRNGRRQQISIVEIVVGDVICLKIGDQVPADGLFIDGHSLLVDESSMTGESDHVEVNSSQNPFLFSGTKVVDGYARMLATSVGMNTTWGQMMSQISRDTSAQTPLQARVNKLTSSKGKVGLAVAFLVLVVLLVRYFTGNTIDENGSQEFNGSNTKVHDIVNTVMGIVAAAATIAVVAIPEGLPSAFTLILAYTMKKMMADQAMVRKFSACEKMGSATVICTDKTGTLTLNQMKVSKFFLDREPIDEGAASSISPWVVELIQQGVALNTTGGVYWPTSGAQFEFSGSPTEKAILSWAVQEFDMDMEAIKQSCIILQVEAFNSQEKRSGVMLKNKTDNTVHVHWKGAAEMILAMCSKYYDVSGNMKRLDDGANESFEKIIQGMAASSLRCIAFAHKQVPEEEHEDGKDQKKLNEDSFTLIGLVGIKDPCRPGVKTAVEECQYAGVSVKMITGDNVFTAQAIATECGILKSNQDMSTGAVVDGAEFRNYTPEERMAKIDNICVMARSSPLDKLLMVHSLKQAGHVVAVTGNSTDDTPAFMEADIGLSMGIQGTEVAKEGSDIVIMNDNFSSVASALRWGRYVYTNMQKFIQFQLTIYISTLVINVVTIVSVSEIPLTTVELLRANMILDTLGILALATKGPTKELMDKPPVSLTEPLITNVMWRNHLAQASYQIAVLLTLQFRGQSIFGVNEKVKETLIFNTFVLCQVLNEFNSRKLEKKNVFEGIYKDKLFLAIIATTIVVQVLMVEFLKKFADIERLNWGQWGACIGIAAVSWPIDWVVKCIPVPKKPFFSHLHCILKALANHALLLPLPSLRVNSPQHASRTQVNLDVV